jgi:hypothetical protein
MLRIALYIPLLIAIGCFNRQSEPEQTSISSELRVSTPPTSLSPLDTSDLTSDEERFDQWAWGEDNEVTRPTKSSISDFSYPKELLLRKWGRSGDNMKVMAFTPSHLDVFDEKYIYKISHDSLWVFTGADHPNGGVDGGIVTKLTQDSLIVAWSTGDIDTYVVGNK